MTKFFKSVSICLCVCVCVCVHVCAARVSGVWTNKFLPWKMSQLCFYLSMCLCVFVYVCMCMQLAWPATAQIGFCGNFFLQISFNLSICPCVFLYVCMCMQLGWPASAQIGFCNKFSFNLSFLSVCVCMHVCMCMQLAWPASAQIGFCGRDKSEIVANSTLKEVAACSCQGVFLSICAQPFLVRSSSISRKLWKCPLLSVSAKICSCCQQHSNVSECEGLFPPSTASLRQSLGILFR